MAKYPIKAFLIESSSITAQYKKENRHTKQSILHAKNRFRSKMQFNEIKKHNDSQNMDNFQNQRLYFFFLQFFCRLNRFW